LLPCQDTRTPLELMNLSRPHSESLYKYFFSHLEIIIVVDTITYHKNKSLHFTTKERK